MTHNTAGNRRIAVLEVPILKIAFKAQPSLVSRSARRQKSPAIKSVQVPGSGVTLVVPPKSTVNVRSESVTVVEIGKSGGSEFGPVRFKMSNSPALPGKIASQESTATGYVVVPETASITALSPSTNVGEPESVAVNVESIVADPELVDTAVGLNVPVNVAPVGVGFVPPIGIAVPL